MGHHSLSSLSGFDLSPLYVERDVFYTDPRSTKAVGRALSIRQVFALLSDRDRPLYSLVGPPGVGKSWYLWRVYLAMKARGASPGPARFLPLYLDLGAWPVREQGLAGALNPWLNGVLAENKLSGLPEWQSFFVRFERFAREICDKCGGGGVAVLALDGLDELDDEHRETFLIRVVTVFAKEAEHACTRVLMAHRDPQLMLAYPRFRQQRLELKSDLDTLQPGQQIERLLGHVATEAAARGAAYLGRVLHHDALSDRQAARAARRAADHAAAIQTEMADFLSGNFFMNAHLLGDVLLNEQLRVVPDYLWSGLRHYMARTNPGRDAGQREQDLQTARALIALLRDETLEPECGRGDPLAWAASDLEARRTTKKLGEKVFAWEKGGDLDPLFKAGIIVLVKDLYQIDPTLVHWFNNLERLGRFPARLPRA